VTHTRARIHAGARAHTDREARSRTRGGSAVLMAALRGVGVVVRRYDAVVVVRRPTEPRLRPASSPPLPAPLPRPPRSFFFLSLQRARNPGVGSARPGKYAPDKGDPPAVESLCSDYPRLPRRPYPSGWFYRRSRDPRPTPPTRRRHRRRRRPDDELESARDADFSDRFIRRIT